MGIGHAFAGALLLHFVASTGGLTLLLIAWGGAGPPGQADLLVVAAGFLGAALLSAGLAWEVDRRARGWPAWDVRCLQDRRTLALLLALFVPFSATAYWLLWGRDALDEEDRLW